MSSILPFDGRGDVTAWMAKVKAKLISKGYKSHLRNENKPAAGADRVAWEANADKAVGIILTYLELYLANQFENKASLQELFEAIEVHYRPDLSQEIDRLEREFTNLSYNAEDPILWVANVRGLVARLTTKGAPPTDRQIRAIVLRALEEEPEYKIRVELIRHSQPNITQAELWAAIGRFPYPLKSSESAFNIRDKSLKADAGKSMISSARYIKGGKSKASNVQGQASVQQVREKPRGQPQQKPKPKAHKLNREEQ